MAIHYNAQGRSRAGNSVNCAKLLKEIQPYTEGKTIKGIF